ncbi:MAG: hypothetical protein NVSMB14_16410 [Isosphaeraceae bacterium]
MISRTHGLTSMLFALWLGASHGVGCNKVDGAKRDDSEKSASLDKKSKKSSKLDDDEEKPSKKKKSSDDDEAKPKKKKKKKDEPQPAKNPVPSDWITMVNEKRGFEFKVPKGTVHTDETFDGVDQYSAKLPKPYAVELGVIAFKDATLTREDLIKKGVHLQEVAGASDVTVSKLEERGADYSLATYTETEKDGTRKKGMMLVAADVTDNYVMFIEDLADRYDADADTIDKIWRSFTMYSNDSRAGDD